MSAGGLKVWNGSSWVSTIPKVWDGSSWTSVTNGYVWNGSSWEQFYPGIGNTVLYNGGTVTGYLYYQNYYSGYFMTSTETFYGWYNNNGTAPSPSTLTTGKTIKSWYNYFYTDYNNHSNDYSASILEISGFASDPGSSYIYSCKLGNSTFVYSSSASYSYYSGTASWQWPSVNTLNGAVFTIGQTGSYTGYIYQ
jgi:hypothetical protein